MSARRTVRRGVDLLLQPERVEAALWRGYANARDPEVRILLFEHFRPFAARLSRAQFEQRKSSGAEHDDIEQLAYEALLEAIERFDLQRNVPFEAYARIRIKGHIANGLAQRSEAAAQSHHRKRTERERLNSLRRPAEDDKDPLAALSALSATIALGLMLEAEGAVDIEAIPDPAPSAYESLAWNELSANVNALLDNLPERESFVLRQHYRNGVSFQQISLLLGVTRGRVSQIHRSGLERMRGRLEKLR